MKITGIRMVSACLFSALMAAAQQTPTRAVGVVDAIDPGSGQITLHTDAGPSIKIIPQTDTKFVRVVQSDAGKPAATPIKPGDIQTGDRVLARGALSDDKNSLAATVVMVMTKGDVAKKQQDDQADWRKRGVLGIVTAVDSAANTATVNTRTAEGTKPLVIQLGAKSVVRRYAQDSVKFSDAKPSSLVEIKPGDQVRALGDKAPDGSSLTAEAVVFGSFRNVAATVTSINGPDSTLKVTDLATKKPLLVKITNDSTMRKLPENFARMIAMRNSGGTPGSGAGGAGASAGAPGGASGTAASGGARPGGGQAWQGGQGGQGSQGGQGGAGGMRRGDMQQFLERMPPIKIEDLKPGDAIIVSSTQGTDPGQVTAITLVAGVEAILTAAPAGSQRGAAMLGSWNLEMNMGVE